MSDSSFDLKSVVIYTDGGCIGNPGPGGYGVVLLYGQKRRELSGGFRLTTNNRMELMAAIAGLESLRYRCNVTVYTDSQYVARSVMDGWASRWRRNGWKRNQKEKAVNPDLWERLLDLCAHHIVRFEWVKGHAGNAENECCDRLSMLAAYSENLPMDEGYEGRDREQMVVLGDAVLAIPPTDVRVNATKITQEGQPCRKCGASVVKRIPVKKHKPGQEYCYEYYLSCPKCGAMYMVDAAKRYLT